MINEDTKIKADSIIKDMFGSLMKENNNEKDWEKAIKNIKKQILNLNSIGDKNGLIWEEVLRRVIIKFNRRTIHKL